MKKKPKFFKNTNNLIINSFWLKKIINILIKHTYHAKIECIIFKTCKYLKYFTKTPITIELYQYIKMQKLLFKILKVKIAGRIYQLPTNFDFFNRYATLLRNTLKNKIISNNISNKFSILFSSQLFQKNSISEKIRDEIYKNATVYRGYLHFRWRN